MKFEKSEARNKEDEEQGDEDSKEVKDAISRMEFYRRKLTDAHTLYLSRITNKSSKNERDTKYVLRLHVGNDFASDNLGTKKATANQPGQQAKEKNIATTTNSEARNHSALALIKQYQWKEAGVNMSFTEPVSVSENTLVASNDYIEIKWPGGEFSNNPFGLFITPKKGAAKRLRTAENMGRRAEKDSCI